MKIYISFSNVPFPTSLLLRASPKDERALSYIINAQALDLIERKLNSFLGSKLFMSKKANILKQVKRHKEFLGEESVEQDLNNPTFNMRSAPVTVTVVTEFGNKKETEAEIHTYRSTTSANRFTATLYMRLVKPSYLFSTLTKYPNDLPSILSDAHDVGCHELVHALQPNLQPTYSKDYALNRDAQEELDRIAKKYWVPLTRSKRGLKLLKYLTSPTEIEPQILTAMLDFKSLIVKPEHTKLERLELKNKFLGIGHPKMSAEQVINEILYDSTNEKSSFFYALKSLDPYLYGRALYKFNSVYKIDPPVALISNK